MGLAVTNKNRKKNAIWYVGQDIGVIENMAADIEFVSAYGNELDYIISRISGIPKPINNESSFYWYGDIARTIILNL